LRAHDETTAAAIRRRDQAVARVEAADRRLAEFDAAERKQARKSADAEAEQTAAALREGLAQIEKIACNLVSILAANNAATDAVNRSAPSDEALILCADARVRAGDIRPRKVVSETTVDRWCYRSSGNFISDEAAKNVRTAGGDQGTIQVRSANEMRTVPVVLKRFCRRKFLSQERAHHELPLLKELQQIVAMATIEREDTRPIEIELIPIKEIAAAEVEAA
jgi:hypothetical protein